MDDADIPVLRLAGRHREIGAQHGHAMRARIHAFLDDRLCRINAVVAAPLSLAGIGPYLDECAGLIERHVPGLHEELHGLAEGAEISFEQALLLQVRRELAGFTRMPAGGDCTSFVVGAGSDTTLAQTIDLNGSMRPELSVLHINRPAAAGPRHALLVSFTGLLGYLGMNERGLAVGLNLVLGGTWGPGIPGYMAIRHLLDSASSVDEALIILDGLPLASSRSLMLCDGARKVVVEYIRTEQHRIEMPALVHANHFMHAAFHARDELNPLAAIFSRQREAACRDRLDALDRFPTPDDCMRILGAPPIHVSGATNVRHEETVATVVMQPGAGTMWLRKAEGGATQIIQMNA